MKNFDHSQSSDAFRVPLTNIYKAMDAEKKPKRPRIGSTPELNTGTENSDHSNRYEKVNYPEPGQPRDPDAQRPRTYTDRQSGYQQNRFNPSYQPGGYRQQPQQFQQGADGEMKTGDAYGQQGNDGQSRYNRQGGYNQNRQGGYNQNRQGGYNQNRQGGYNQNRQGGYNQNRPGGYNQNRQGGYNQNNRQGGYNQNRPGGYNQNRPGGYNQNNRQGGYNQNRPGGYNQNRLNNRNQQGYRKQQKPNLRFTPRPKQIEYVLNDIDPNELIRLNKYMANAGLCSRREADEYIQAGKVSVNGTVVTELGTKISRSDVVECDGKVVTPEKKCYVLLNKPKDCVTTSDDPNGRTTVLDIVKNACQERIYPVGRLDRNTTGVLLLTNDGDLASKLTHPKFVKKKIYQVWTDKDITEEDMQRIADGIELEDGEIHADAISYVSETDRNQAGIEIHSGRNRIVRRIFEHLGYRVTKLDRVYFAGLTKKNLPRGRWRYLTQEEVNFLRMGAFE